MNNIYVDSDLEKELFKAISKQVTDNVPKLYIQDIISGRVFEYGKNCHDRLVISEDGRCLYYENLQNGDGSDVGNYRFYYEKPKIETEEDKRYAYDIEEWARNVEHLSVTELLAEERKNLVKEIRQDLANKLTYNINDLENIMVICNKINSVLDKFERGELCENQ